MMFGRLKLKDYSGLLMALIPKYRVMSVGEYLEMPPVGNVAVIVHPVHKMVERVSAMALVEKRLGLRATYYFSWDPKAVHWAGTGESRFGNFPELAVVEAKLYGHEVGYLPDGDDHVARLERLGTLVPVRTSYLEVPDMMGGPWSPEFSGFLRVGQSSKGWSVDGARSNLGKVVELLKSGKHDCVILTMDPSGWK
jgi:hypothetical protein